jgi:hypothetical protein
VTEPSYEPRETGRPPKEDESMVVWTGLLVVVWFVTIILFMEASWATLSFNIDVVAQISPFLFASILITIFWFVKKSKMKTD